MAGSGRHYRRVFSIMATLGLVAAMFGVSSGIAAAAPSSGQHTLGAGVSNPVPRAVNPLDDKRQAKMYAQPIKVLGGTQIQIFTQLCNKADQSLRCIPTTFKLRAALSRITNLAGQSIVWVDTAVQDGSYFWVLSPIRFRVMDNARFRFHAEETAPFGCVTNGNRLFHWSDGAWHLAGGGSSTGCP